MTFKKLATFLDALEKTASRIEITRILSDLFKNSKSTQIDKTVNLLLGQLAPSYQTIVFNLAERMMLDVLVQAYDVKKDKVRQLYKEEGDLGNLAARLAQNSKTKSKSSGVSVADVYQKLLEIAREEGEKSGSEG